MYLGGIIICIFFLCSLLLFLLCVCVVLSVRFYNQQAVREAATICPRPMQVDLLTWKMMSESRVTWPIYVPILVFLGLSVLCSRLRPDVRDRQTDVTSDRRQTRIIA